MGNKTGGEKQKPLLMKSSPSEAGAYNADFTTHGDHEVVTLKKDGFPDAYYLPWESSRCTQCEVSLAKRQFAFFFTASLSGCSLWYKFSDGGILIRHEARVDKSVHKEHQLAGFKLIIDSSANEKDCWYTVDESTLEKHAQFFMVYALIDYDEKQLEFRAQLVKQKKTLDGDESYELVRLDRIEIAFPKD